MVKFAYFIYMQCDDIFDCANTIPYIVEHMRASHTRHTIAIDYTAYFLYNQTDRINTHTGFSFFQLCMLCRCCYFFYLFFSCVLLLFPHFFLSLSVSVILISMMKHTLRVWRSDDTTGTSRGKTCWSFAINFVSGPLCERCCKLFRNKNHINLEIKCDLVFIYIGINRE